MAADGGAGANVDQTETQQRRANVKVNKHVTVEAPSLEEVALHFEETADELENEHGGEASGRSLRTRAEGQGKAAAYREAAEFLRNLTITG